jgi:endonuclease YncB( thermonuclease family)
MGKRCTLTKLIFGLLLTLMHLVSHAEVMHGHVVHVADGDTITVLDENKQKHVIRLMGIDAPEKKQKFGEESKLSMIELANDKEVEVTWFKNDRYGRTVGQVRVDGLDVCLEQIKRGLAWHYKQYEREQSKEDRSRYRDAETEARQAKLGLWVDPNPIEPSKFRHANK